MKDPEPPDPEPPGSDSDESLPNSGEVIEHALAAIFQSQFGLYKSANPLVESTKTSPATISRIRSGQMSSWRGNISRLPLKVWPRRVACTLLDLSDSGLFSRHLKDACPEELRRLNELSPAQLVQGILAAAKGAPSLEALAQLLYASIARLSSGGDSRLLAHITFGSGILLGQCGHDVAANQAWQATLAWPGIDKKFHNRVFANVLVSQVFLGDPAGAFRAAKTFLGVDGPDSSEGPDIASRTHCFIALVAGVAASHLLEEKGFRLSPWELDWAYQTLLRVAENAQAEKEPTWAIEAFSTASVLAIYQGHDGDALSKQAESLLQRLRKESTAHQVTHWQLQLDLDRARESVHEAFPPTSAEDDFMSQHQEDTLKALNEEIAAVRRKLDPDLHRDIARRCDELERFAESKMPKPSTTPSPMDGAPSVGKAMLFLITLAAFLLMYGSAFAHNTC